MSLSNKTFKNNATGELIKVIDSFENIAILENKGKADVSQLLNPDLYTEQIDPSSFFNNQGAYNSLADKIKSIPADKIRDDEGNGEVIVNVDGNNQFKPQTNESAIIQVSEEDERAELARKYGVSTPQNDIDKQNQAFAKLLGEEEEVVQTVQVNREEPQRPYNPPVQQIQQTQQAEDPIITMFKNVKRVKDFSISLEIKNRIPRPDFIEMMEDSYNTSIIDFLAAEFTDNILKNPQIIEDMIRQKIKELVYGAEVKAKINDQITDSVTQIKDTLEPIVIPTKNSSDREKMNEGVDKPKTTRKPRAKKEVSK